MFRPAFSPPLPSSNTTKLDVEAFFSKYKSLLTPEEFGRFHDLVSKTRPSRGHRYFISSFDGRLEFEHDCYERMDAQRSKDADVSKLEVILVEDVDVRCLVALDATYQLDPQFLPAYTGAGHKHSPDIEAVADPAGMAGKWYTTEISMLLQFPWQVEDSRIVNKFASLDESWYKRLLTSHRNTEPEAAKPWWKEGVRTKSGFATTNVSSKVACYCLTDKLRLVLVESLPRLVQPWRMSVDYKKIRPSKTHFHLPIPLKYWRHEAFSVFDLLDKMMLRFSFQDPQLRYILLSDELARLEFGMVAKLLDERLIVSPLVEYAWSSSVEHLSDQLSLRRSQALMRPSMATYLPLVDLRRPILGMLDAVSVAIKDAPSSEEAYHHLYPMDPSTPWSRALRDANSSLQALQRELTDEIHLVIGAVTVQDSDASKRQAERATLLTLVAAVYLPLTLVTSIFGMNIREVDGDLLTYRACLKALGVVLGCTIVFALAYREWRRWRRRREEGSSADRHFRYA